MQKKTQDGEKIWMKVKLVWTVRLTNNSLFLPYLKIVKSMSQVLSRLSDVEMSALFRTY